MLPTRFALLKSAVLTLSVVAWRTTRDASASGATSRLWTWFGWLVLAISAAFMFAWVPVPVALSIWGLALAASYLRATDAVVTSAASGAFDRS